MAKQTRQTKNKQEKEKVTKILKKDGFRLPHGYELAVRKKK